MVGIYQPHDYADEKCAALDMWGRYVSMILDEPVRQATKAELDAGGDREGQVKARRSFNNAITGGDESWRAYVDSIMNPSRKVLSMRDRRL